VPPVLDTPFLDRPFALDISFDLAATFLFAVTGSLVAIQKRYDAVGVAVLAFVTGLGGALLRDGLFLQGGPPAVITDGRYLAAVLAGAVAATFYSRHLHRLRLVFTLADALALGTYAMVGAQKSIAAGLPLLTATLVGVVNAVGGGLLRDVLVREEPLVFKPGEFYALAALAGVVLFLVLGRGLGVPATLAALVGIVAAFAVRMLSVRLGWRTGALWDEEGQSGP
jgi:uncharacterized membrane protein YeiH